MSAITQVLLFACGFALMTSISAASFGLPTSNLTKTSVGIYEIGHRTSNSLAMLQDIFIYESHFVIPILFGTCLDFVRITDLNNGQGPAIRNVYVTVRNDFTYLHIDFFAANDETRLFGLEMFGERLQFGELINGLRGSNSVLVNRELVTISDRIDMRTVMLSSAIDRIELRSLSRRTDVRTMSWGGVGKDSVTYRFENPNRQRMEFEVLTYGNLR